ncbi:MAG: STAS domain-containing protein [Spirochaetes bacterium]|nr:STAS domain-containing protein [Spirochaetota bacterium]
MKQKKDNKEKGAFSWKIKKKEFYVDLPHEKSSIDIKNVSEFADIMKKGISKGVETIHIDLSNLVFIDTSGLGKLLSFSKMARIILYNVSEEIKKVLEITHLLPFFNIK